MPPLLTTNATTRALESEPFTETRDRLLVSLAQSPPSFYLPPRTARGPVGGRVYPPAVQTIVDPQAGHARRSRDEDLALCNRAQRSGHRFYRPANGRNYPARLAGLTTHSTRNASTGSTAAARRDGT